jgi:hypothetical protein
VVSLTSPRTTKRRSQSALGEPPDDLSGFPHLQDSPPSWFRAHIARPDPPDRDRGCWWFTGITAHVPAEGRFDLPMPSGTCYFADSPEAAVRERIGHYLADRDWVPASEVDGRLVTEVTTLHTQSRPIADATRAEAIDHFGATRELGTLNAFDVTARWAPALHGAGFAGLVYRPRFSPGHERAVATFGKAGVRTWAVRSSEPMRDVAVRMQIRLASTPSYVATQDDAEPEP